MRKRSYGSVTVWSLDREKVLEALRAKAEELLALDARVQEVILFGSLARGNYTPSSDADVCVVLSEDSRRQMDRIPEFLVRFTAVGIPVDVLVYTREEIERMRRDGRRFVREDLAVGIVLAGRDRRESPKGSP